MSNIDNDTDSDINNDTDNDTYNDSILWQASDYIYFLTLTLLGLVFF